MKQKPTKIWPIILFGFVWILFYRFVFSIENAFRNLGDRFIPWPWQLRWDEFWFTVLIPGIIFAAIIWWCFRKPRMNFPPDHRKDQNNDN